MTADFASLGEYDAHHRAAAASTLGTGSLPVRRSVLPNSVPDLDHVRIVTASGAKLTMRNPATGKAQALNGKSIAQTLSTDYLAEVDEETGQVRSAFKPNHLMLVCDTPRTMTLLREKVRRSKGAPAGLKRQLDTLSAYPLPSSITVLTRLLSEKFWAPEDFDANDISEWADAFGLDTGIDSLAKLVGKALVCESSQVLSLVKRRANVEGYLRSAAWYNSAPGQYRQLSAIREIDDTLEGLDDVLFARACLSGQTVTLKPEGDDLFAVEGPFKTKAGRAIYLTDFSGETGLVEAAISDITIDDDRRTLFRLCATKKWLPAFTAASASEVVYVVDRPIFRMQKKATRWAKPAEVDSHTASASDVPAAIAAASAV